MKLLEQPGDCSEKEDILQNLILVTAAPMHYQPTQESHYCLRVMIFQGRIPTELNIKPLQILSLSCIDANINK